MKKIGLAAGLACHRTHGEHGLDAVLSLKSIEVIASANVATVNEDLGQRTTTVRAFGHFIPSVFVAVYAVFGVVNVFAVE
jgi:hypothetical protein